MNVIRLTVFVRQNDGICQVGNEKGQNPMFCPSAKRRVKGNVSRQSGDRERQVGSALSGNLKLFSIPDCHLL